MLYYVSLCVGCVELEIKIVLRKEMEKRNFFFYRDVNAML